MAKTLADAVHRCALAALGTAETGRNTGPTIDGWLRSVGVEPPAAWCAAAVTAWLREAAADLGVRAPIPGSASARAIEAQLLRCGLLLEINECDLTKIAPGDLVIWWRTDPNGWQGHIGVVHRAGKLSLSTIEANSGAKGDRVAKMTRSVRDVRLVGFGLLHEIYAPSEHALRRAGELIRISRELMAGRTDPLAHD